MEKELVIELENTASELLEVINGFGQDIFNTVPFEGSWTPGQVVEHVYLAASGIEKTVRGRVEPAKRDPRQMVAPLREAFLNFSVKMQSPDFILPTDKPKDKLSLMQSLRDTFTNLGETARTQDLLVSCLDFEMPMVGTMTRIEWLSFAVVHTRRHIFQLQKMAKPE